MQNERAKRHHSLDSPQSSKSKHGHDSLVMYVHLSCPLRSVFWLNAMHSGKKWQIRESSYLTYFSLNLSFNPYYISAPSLRSLRSNGKRNKQHKFETKRFRCKKPVAKTFAKESKASRLIQIPDTFPGFKRGDRTDAPRTRRGVSRRKF